MQRPRTASKVLPPLMSDLTEEMTRQPTPHLITPWLLRGYTPPKHLRVPHFSYSLAEDSTSEILEEQTRECLVTGKLPVGTKLELEDSYMHSPVNSPGEASLGIRDVNFIRGDRVEFCSINTRAFVPTACTAVM